MGAKLPARVFQFQRHAIYSRAQGKEAINSTHLLSRLPKTYNKASAVIGNSVANIKLDLSQACFAS